jgi:type I restriction enzyme S subunit
MGVKDAAVADYDVMLEPTPTDDDVPPGYKRTEAGVIPEDWVSAPFAALFSRINAKDHQVLVADYQQSGQLPIVDQGQRAIAGWTDRVEKRFKTPDGGVIVFGDHTRSVKYISFDLVIGADGTQLLVGKHGVSTRFLAYQLATTDIPNTGYNRHFKFLIESRFAAPASLAEQQAIAEALSDADALIGSLQQLIAKKRALKHGAMQALLTGRQRLPSFTGEWRTSRLGDFGVTYGGLTGKAKQHFGVGTARYIPFMNVMANVVIDCDALEWVDVGPSEQQNNVAKGDLLFNGSSETPEEVGFCSALLADLHNVFLNSFCFGFRPLPHAELDPSYLAYFFRSLAGRQLIAPLAQGATRYNLSKAALRQLEFELPPREEQTAIAAVLSDMDAEIEALEARLAKTRALKAGMMQQLLTGRIRLV